jgi:hypothetical protein
MEAHLYNLPIRVLVSLEGREYCARALELDLLGYGKTAGEALGNLREVVEAQVSFAHQMGSPELLGFPAEKEYFDRWEEAQRNSLTARLLGDRSASVNAQACFISFTPEELEAMTRKRQFRPADLSRA